MSKPTAKNPLGTHEGRRVGSTGVSLRKAGDGLSAALKTDPRLLDPGERVFLVIEATCVGVNYEVVDRKYPAEGDLERIHVLDAGTSTFVDEELVGKVITEQAERNAARADAERGQLNLDPERSHRGEHLLGLHDADADGPQEGCPQCFPPDD